MKVAWRSLAFSAKAQGESVRQILIDRNQLLQAEGNRMETGLEIATDNAPTAVFAESRAGARGKARRLARAGASETRGGVLLEIAVETRCRPEQDTVSRQKAWGSSQGGLRHPFNIVNE